MYKNEDQVKDCYAYLKLKGEYRFEELALRILWLADYLNLRKYGFTCTGENFPITKLDEIKLIKCKKCGLEHTGEEKYCLFENLSVVICMSLDEAFASVVLGAEDFELREFKSYEEILEGAENKEAILEYIKDYQEALKLIETIKK